MSCWGQNTLGQLGDGTTIDRAVPAPVSNLTHAAEISAAGNNTCARLESGFVWCWGANISGTLNGELSNQISVAPVTLSGVANVVEIAVGGDHSCARLESSDVFCWGNNFFGGLGDGTTDARLYPVPVIGLEDAVEVVSGGGYTCVRLNTEAVSCWGYNINGQLGDSTRTDRFVPTPVMNLP